MTLLEFVERNKQQARLKEDDFVCEVITIYALQELLLDYELIRREHQELLSQQFENIAELSNGWRDFFIERLPGKFHEENEEDSQLLKKRMDEIFKNDPK